MMVVLFLHFHSVVSRQPFSEDAFRFLCNPHPCVPGGYIGSTVHSLHDEKENLAEARQAVFKMIRVRDFDEWCWNHHRFMTTMPSKDDVPAV